jgi:hypothetical protein
MLMRKVSNVKSVVKDSLNIVVLLYITIDTNFILLRHHAKEKYQYTYIRSS